MSAGRFIAGDWGSTWLRLFLCEGERVLQTRTGSGIGRLAGSAEAEFMACTASWMREPGVQHAVLCGMVGSRTGWRETSYVGCPATLADLRKACVHLPAAGLDVTIVPGVACTGPLDAPEAMRGEETQIIGALQLCEALGRGRHLLALPGTHTKWVTLEDGCIVSFQTALTGELFTLLCEHSLLMRAAAGNAGPMSAHDLNEDAFARGLTASAHAGSTLLHGLFQVRSRQLMEGVPRDWALDFLSGILIGSDVAGALALFPVDAAARIVLVGASALTDRYARALERRGMASMCLDGDECALAGLRALLEVDAR